MDTRNLAGPLKAAILIRSLGPEVTGTVLNGLSDDEKKVVNQHLDKMGTISTQVIEYVAREFTANAALKTRAAQLAAPVKANQTPKGLQGKEDPSEETQGLEAILSLDADEIYKEGKEYAKIAGTVMPMLKDRCIPVIAGYPGKQLDVLKHNGIEHFIHVRSNVLQELQNFQHLLGIQSRDESK